MHDFLNSKLIPVCKPVREGRVRLPREDGAYFGKNGCGWFFGVNQARRGPSLWRPPAVILRLAKWVDQDVALALLSSLQSSTALADLGHRGQGLQRTLLEQTELLIQPAAA